MRHKRILNLAIASALGLLAPVSVNAFGLGKIEINSALNEPFSAEIPVTALKFDEADNLQVRLASVAEFEKSGLERNFILTDFSFEVVQNSASDVVIKIASNKSVREPLLDFLLTATAGNGRLIREYTVLLDPPKHVLAKPQTTQNLEPVVSDTRQTASPSAPEAQRNNVVTTPSYQSDQYGVTTSTDTLWNIAKKVRPNNAVSMNQMMVSLLNENPHAFRHNNINGLKTGEAITVPSLNDINKLSKAEATQIVKQQNQQWKNRNKPAVVTQTEVSEPIETTVDTAPFFNEDLSAGGSEQLGATDDSDSMNEAAAESKLSLVTPSQGSETVDDATSPLGNEQLEQLQEQLTFAQETIEAQAQQNIDIQSRMDAMEEQLETMRRLISLKDADLARLQDLLEEEQQDDPSINEQLESALDTTVENVNELVENAEEVAQELGQNIQEKASELEADVFASDESTQAEAEAMQADKLTSQAETSESQEQAQTDSSDSTVNTVINTVTDLTGYERESVEKTVEQATSFFEKNKIPLSVAGLLILVILLLLMRRKKDDVAEEDETESPIVITEAVEDSEDDVEDITDSESTTASEVSEVNVKTAADLIEQADVFVGYADYAQARTSLEQARFIEPDNRDAVTKLLFVLYKQQQAEKFIQLIADAGLDESDEQWSEIAEWGSELAPDSELFSSAETEVDEFEPEPEAVEEQEQLVDEPEVAEAETIAFESDFGTETSEDSLDIDTTTLDEVETTEVQEEPQADGNDSYLEFDVSDYQTDTQDDSLEVGQDTSQEPDLTLDISESSEQDLTSDVDLTTGFEASELDDLNTSNENDEFDLDLNFSEQTETSELETNDLSLDDSLSFELDQLDETNSVDSDDSLSLDTDLNTEAELNSLDISTSTSSSELEFDLDNFDEIDEAETKLDLAVAYIDMGDPDGAKSILEEVIADGSDEQKSRAQELLDSLS